MGFTKKSIGTADIKADKLEQFLHGSKDEQMQDNSSIVTNNVDVNSKRIQQTESVTNLIGRGATFETNFKRQTFYIHNDLIKRLDKIAKKASRGEKTKIINAALEQYLNKIQ